ncbi:calcium-binding protein [Hahella aquimaris]|uniref:calcium-binding protein n=1 Tax=Hahella sp. HNIBRBA332 TaxID=3015983 RepID=UPI00273AFB92|nr:calcium-binding protein [Hahella sp. HNIBRBA332]WLQ16976.1 calcium-binding protein [Hahella sp. HNIBRBA332]
MGEQEQDSEGDTLDISDMSSGVVITREGNEGITVRESKGDGSIVVRSVETIKGTSHDDEIEVGDNGVRIFGESGNDTLKGGKGEDRLEGGEGSDTLEGGEGFDTYVSDSSDTLKDSDGNGTVKLEDTTLVGGTRKEDDPENVYKSKDGRFTYELNGSVLTVNGGLTINDFSNGDLGIRLETEDEPDDPPQHDPDNSVVRRDPLAFDLDNSGAVETSALAASTTYFDIDSDGIAERVGWINARDGLLVNDLNENGSIDDINELFGGADVDGFEALRVAGDENEDGVIDAKDAIYSKLQVWTDTNQDGLSQEGELHSLQDLGIEAIKLDHETVDKDSNGNRIIAEGSIVRNGEEAYAAAFDLQLDNRITKDPGSHTLNQSVLQDLLQRGIQLPLLRGFGSVKDLQTVYAQNEATLALVQSLAGSDAKTVYDNFGKVLADWSGLTALREQAGLDTSKPLSTTEKLWILESFSGLTQFKESIESQFAEGKSPYVNRINTSYLDERFHALSMHFANRFLAQSVLAEAFSGALYSISSNKMMVTDAAKLQTSLAEYAKNVGSKDDAALLAQVYSAFRTQLNIDENAVVTQLQGHENASVFHDLLTGALQDVSIWNNNYSGSEGHSYIIGSAGADRLNGNGGDDVLEGREGSDTLTGGKGSDRIVGGVGDDNLQGGEGDDRYEFSAGDGRDVINNSNAAGEDRIYLDASITQSDVRLARNGRDLLVHIGEEGQVIRVSSYFNEDGATGYAVDFIEFADGTVWDVATVKQKVQVPTEGADEIWGYDAVDDNLKGLSGNDSLYGQAGADTLSGDAGNDYLHGGQGDDKLYGGEGADNLRGDVGDDLLVGDGGDDSLSGGAGKDVYQIAKGDGHDTITEEYSETVVDRVVFGAGILAENTVLLRRGWDLLISIDDGAQTVRINNYFNKDASTGFALESIEFADGTLWDIDTVKAKVLIPTEGQDEIWGYDATNDNLTGLAGNDVIRGQKGNDVIDAGDGADKLYGDEGDDVLTGGKGDDSLDGGAGSDTFHFNLGDGADTIIDRNQSGSDINTLQFGPGISKDDFWVRRSGDSLVLFHKNMQDRVTVSRYFEKDGLGEYALSHIRFDDGSELDLDELKKRAILPTDDADTIYGFSTNDVLNGLKGNDVLYGKDGDDIILGQEGEDRLYGENGQDELQGGLGEDSLYGGADKDRLFGQEGNDSLYGGDGDDDLIGGVGDDHLEGGAGDDNYYFTKGDGKDSIYDNNGKITIYVSEIELDDVIFRRNGRHLDVLFKQTDTDKITIRDYYPDFGGIAGRSIGFFLPGSGLSHLFSAEDINAKSMEATEKADVIYGDLNDNRIDGLQGNDLLNGDRGNDELLGGAGNDQLLGGHGDDTLNGGVGDDTLTGGEGADIYQFTSGDGRDVINNNDSGGSDAIVFAASVTPSSVRVSRASNNLQLDYGSGDQVLVHDFFRNEGTTGYAIDEVRFADGTVWDKETLLDMALIGGDGDETLIGYSTDDILSGAGGADTLLGNDGADSLSGGAGADDLQGGAGNDVLAGDAGDDKLAGGEGDDLYRFARGDGKDVITDVNGADRIEFTDIASTAVRVRREGGNLVISVPGSDDQITITGQYLGEQLTPAASSVESVTFSDGVTWDFAALMAQAVVGSADADVIQGFSNGETISTLDGNDKVRAGDGDDDVDGGVGDDELYGDSGADLLKGGLGADRLDGGAGEDRLFGGDGGDTLFGGSGNDELFGEEGADTLRGGDGQDQLSGGLGADELFGDSGADVLSGGEGNDTLHGGSGDDVLNGDAGDDKLYGDGGQDELYGGAGKDELYGSGQLFGGEGEDILEGQGTLDGGDGNDELRGLGSDTLLGGAGDDVLIANTNTWAETVNTLAGGTGNDTLYGSFGDDTYLFNLGDGRDTLIERREGEAFNNIEPSSDTLKFGEGVKASDLSFTRRGNDLIIEHSNGVDGVTIKNWYLGSTDHFKVNQFQFADGSALSDADIEARTVTLGTDAGETLTGYRELNDEIHAGGGDDKVWGRQGNDTIYGDAGVDYLDGDEGDDRLFGGEGDDNLVGRIGDDYLEGGLGDDSLQGNEGADELYGQDGEDSLFGGAGNDLLDGGADKDYFEAGAGDDKVFGGAGNDQLSGNAGDDELTGGEGDDKYVYGPGDGHDVIFNGDGGFDGVLFGGGLNESRLTFSRDGDDLLIAIDDGVNDSVRVKDHFKGGDFAIDWVQPDGSSMINTANINKLAAGGDPDDGGSDGEYDNVMEGNEDGEQIAGTNGRNLIRGLGGDDTIFAFGGDDRIEGGDGGDHLYGGNGSGVGSGNDVIIGGDGNDVLVGEDGDDLLFGGAGDDHYYYKAGQGVDVIDASGGGADWVFFLDGLNRSRLSYHQDGDDLVILVDGDLAQQVRVKDHFLGGEHAIAYVQPTDGGNAIRASSLVGMLTPMPDGSGGDNGGGTDNGGDTGGGTDNGGDNGGSDNNGGTDNNGGDTGNGDGETPQPQLGEDDVINGSGANDTLIGGSGDDTLSGGAGDDLLLGGVGDDVYIYTGGQDVLRDASGVDTLRFGGGITFGQVSSGLTKAGNDLVLKVSGGGQVTLTDFFLGGDALVENIEFETGGQISAQQIFGVFGMSIPAASDYDQTVDGTQNGDSALTAGDGRDLVRGFNGDDILNGGKGDDLLIGGRGDDVYVFNAGGGMDVIDNTGGGFDTLRFEGIGFGQVSSGLQRNGDHLTLNVSGGSDSVTLKNFFKGGDHAIDRIEFASGGQITGDQIFGVFGMSNPDPDGSPNYSGLPDERGFGTVTIAEAGADVIFGSSDGDLIDGGAGDDHLTGGRGDDYLIGGAGNDTYHFAAGDGRDTINDYAGAGEDQLQFAAGVDEQNLWFSRDGDDLVMDLLGSQDQVRVQSWYADNSQQLEAVRTDDAVIDAGRIEQLVSAMAAFDAPVGGEITLSEEQQSQVNAAIAASWQSA